MATRKIVENFPVPTFAPAKKQTIVHFVISIIIYILIPYVSACGPGKTIHRKFTSKYEIMDTQPPNTSEHSISASGPGKRINRTDPSLDAILSTSIVFVDGSLESPNRLAIEPCRTALIRLAEWVDIYFNKKYRIRVLHGYLDEPIGGRSTKSLHLQGRAFDLELVPFHKNEPYSLSEKDKLKNLRKFAGLAYYNARFTFVKVLQHRATKHIHVSCSKERTTQRRRKMRCFPEDASVRLSTGEKKSMKNVQVGDEVLTMTNQGLLKYSKVTMIMHRQDDVTIHDYVTITTSNQKKLILSRYHLTLTSNGDSKFAKDIQIGDNLQTYNAANKSIVTSQVVHVDYDTVKNGAYAPLTFEGTIIVNDVHTSCYAVFPSHSISHSVFVLWRLLSDYLPVYTLQNNEVHWYPKLIESVVNKFYTFPYQL